MAYPIENFGSAPFKIIDGDRGKAYPKQSEFRPSGHCLFLSATNVTKAGFDFGSGQFIDEQKDAQLRKGKLQREDVVLTTRGTLGNVAHYNAHVPFEHVRINSGMVILRCDQSKIMPRYLYAYLRSVVFWRQVERMRSGVAQPQLPIRDMKWIEIPLPTPSQQERLVEVIAAYDDLIENNRRRIALLEEAARLLYREWFVHFRFPGHEHVKITDGLPEGWERWTFDDVCDAIGGGTPKTSKPEYWNDGDILWYTPTDITRNSCLALLDSATKITEAGLRGSSAKMLPVGTVLMTSRASVGFFGIINTPSCTNQGFISIIPNDPRARMYLLHNLMHRVEEIRSHAGGATYKEISKGKFRVLSVVIPEASLLREFEEQASTLHAQVRSLHSMNQKLAQARDLLLPRLMNGEIAV